ncbi:hypothetical protein DRQ25_01605 [Candidatus Fermentibacteria bacterium]|nr:MAG: hypothetical protein DRQ25_01605 [Candidatus Fermentibacteria bacterium]
MTFRNNFVVVVKSKGKVLRDERGYVRLPFGSDYSIVLKNLEGRKAVANVTVDGKRVFGGNEVIVPANNTVEIKGFMGTNNKVRNRFRFIEKTAEISRYRGDRLDDGILRVEFRYERDYEPVLYVNDNPQPWATTWYTGGSAGTGGADWTYTSSNSTGNFSGRSSKSKSSSVNCFYSNSNDQGITVNGKPTRQEFDYGNVGSLESSKYVIVIRLKGRRKDGGRVVKPTTTRTKKRCPTCGHGNKSYHKFCYNCSTCLV